MSSFLHHSSKSSVDIVRAFAKYKSDAPNNDIHDYLKSDMGENRYRDLKYSDSLRLQNIYIRRTALQAGSEEQKGIVNHESVIVELILQKGIVYHILAEKVNDDSARRESGLQLPSGIVIQWIKDFRFNTNQDVKYECFGIVIRLKEVMKVLRTPSPNYDLVEANCWHYAAMVTRDLIKKLLENMNEDNVRLMMQRVLEKAEQNFEHTMSVIETRIGKVAVASDPNQDREGAAFV